MVEQILETIPNKEVYPDYYIVGEHGENNLLVFKDAKGKIIGFTLIEPEQTEWIDNIISTLLLTSTLKLLQ